MIKITTKQGNLISAPEEWALAHCVSQDLSMEKGIALQLRQQQENIGEEDGDIVMEPEWDIFCQEVIKLVKKEDAQEAVYYLSKDGILYRVENDGDKLIVPKTFIPKVMKDFHDSPMVGHPGKILAKYRTSCEACNRRKTSPHVKKAPLQRFPPTTEPWELNSMDVVGPLVTSLDGNRYFPASQDYFTENVGAISPTDQKANTIARAFVENIIVRHGSQKDFSLTEKQSSPQVCSKKKYILLGQMRGTGQWKNAKRERDIRHKKHTELESEEEAEEVGRFHPMMVPKNVRVAPENNTSGLSSEEEETDVHSERGEGQLLEEPAT
ncbi:hypothetical protein JTB14_002104 [Gonioctena quinquepunctata]|nr:hypothetical protein JTB14_002104 [Gonioctena quinquepunctata]